MQFSTAHKLLADASTFADVLDPGLVVPATFGERMLTFRVVELPKFKILSAHVTASDGYILGAEPFTQTVPVGEYRLLLAIAAIESDERIAFAKLQFSDSPAARWEIATQPGQDPKSLKPDEIFGYGVDSGTGCFGDAWAYQLVGDTDRDTFEKMEDESRKVYSHTREWLSIETNRGSFAIFSSGYGDGLYASYFGFSAVGELVSLVTDFGLAKWARS